MLPPRLHLNFSKSLYPYSPFLLMIDTNSIWRLAQLISGEGHRTAVAIAYEIRYLSGFQNELLEHEFDWITEKFKVNDADLDQYFFGLITPPTLIIGADLVSILPLEEIVDSLFPPSDIETIVSLRSYASHQFTPARAMINHQSPDPMDTAAPIYQHCGFELFSESYWYFVGLEASKLAYQNLARLFQAPSLT